jgi:hypothetical protein
LKRWTRVGSKSIDNLSDRLDRLEEEREVKSEDDDSSLPYATAQELEQMTPDERYVAWFNWHVREIMPYYKEEVMRIHNITSDEEYDRRTLEGDQSIYLPQPNSKFESTDYRERVAHVLGLDYQGLQDKINRGEIEDKIATGLMTIDPETGKDISWRDENPNAVF